MRTVQNYTFTNLAVVFILYGITEYFQLNGGIAVLLFAITLGNAHLLGAKVLKNSFSPKPLLDTEKNFFGELVFIMATYFFVYVGVHMVFDKPVLYIMGFIIVVLIILIRPISIKIFVREPMSLRDISIMGIMTPKGLVPAVLASLPLQMIQSGEITSMSEDSARDMQGLAYAVVLLSILICALLVIFFSARSGKKGADEPAEEAGGNEAEAVEAKNEQPESTDAEGESNGNAGEETEGEYPEHYIDGDH